jgi:hypothetical protein
MFLITILKAVALQKEGQLSYIKPLTIKKKDNQLYKAVNNKKKLKLKRVFWLNPILI